MSLIVCTAVVVYLCAHKEYYVVNCVRCSGSMSVKQALKWLKWFVSRDMNNIGMREINTEGDKMWAVSSVKWVM
jgi:hypothetical protein